MPEVAVTKGFARLAAKMRQLFKYSRFRSSETPSQEAAAGRAYPEAGNGQKAGRNEQELRSLGGIEKVRFSTIRRVQEL